MPIFINSAGPKMQLMRPLESTQNWKIASSPSVRMRFFFFAFFSRRHLRVASKSRNRFARALASAFRDHFLVASEGVSETPSKSYFAYVCADIVVLVARERPMVNFCVLQLSKNAMPVRSDASRDSFLTPRNRSRVIPVRKK